MPRLNNDRYIRRHRWLRQLWLQQLTAFSWLRPNQQWDIHDYYRPSEELTREQLLEDRQEIARKRPGLAQRASKALLILAGRAPSPKLPVSKAGKRQIMVRALVRPQIDIERLARAFVSMANQQAREETGQKRDPCNE
jgi:hypothetical protein